MPTPVYIGVVIWSMCRCAMLDLKQEHVAIYRDACVGRIAFLMGLTAISIVMLYARQWFGKHPYRES